VGAAGQKLFVDGQPAGSAATPTASTFHQETNLEFGAGHIYFNSAVVAFGGDLDEVRVWNVERTASEITANYQSLIDPATTGLFGYWRLEQTGSATAAIDQTAAGRPGLLTNFSFSPSPWVGPGAF
jgi:hypothetical protein